VTSDGTLSTASGPAGRVATSLPELVEHVAARYGLGDVAGWSVLETGYEDCNLDLRARQARVVVKVFSAGRPASVPARTAGIISRARAAGVRHPALRRDADGGHVHEYDGHHLFVMDFAPGQSFYEMGRPPSEAELGKVLEQAALIHAIGARPEPVFDPWAIDNLLPLARQVGDLLDAEQRRLVGACLEELAGVRWRELPEALIHADLTAGNLLVAPDGELTVLDFALANRWPRLQELAVIAASLMHGAPGSLRERMEHVATRYSQIAPTPLSPGELGALGAFGRAAAAMELLGGLNQWRQGNRGPETDSLIVIGTTGLRDYELADMRAVELGGDQRARAVRDRGVRGHRGHRARLAVAAQQARQGRRQLTAPGVDRALLGAGHRSFGLVEGVSNVHVFTVGTRCSRGVPAASASENPREVPARAGGNRLARPRQWKA
jgi:Ser/Thr protein kinase RdoA (MazF antagonist)